MWFVFVGVGLLVVIASGMYARRRLSAALAHFGAGDRALSILRWAMRWLLFGYPLLMILSVAFSLATGRSTMVRFDGSVAAWVLAVPFIWAVLVVIQSLPWLVAIDAAHYVVRKHRIAPRLRASAVLAVIVGFAIYTPLRVIVEHRDVRIREHRIGQGATPLRIAFVADVQQDDHTDAARASAVYARVNASQPDLVLSAGDWINAGPDHIEAAAATAAQLKSRLGTFSVRGDHEHFAYLDRDRSVAEVERAMQAHGIQMVTNDVRWFDHAGKRIAVVFLNYNYIQRAEREEIERLLASVVHADYKIVVTHQLDAALAGQLIDRVDLVLGGHTHGGQINPVVGIFHVALARLETTFIDGRYQRGKTTVLITAGVGTSIVPIRYASPGSIEIIDLAP